MSKILIDGRFVGVGESVSRYTLELLREILKLDSKNSYTLLVRPQGEKEVARYGLQEAKNLKLKVLDIPHYSWPEQTELLNYIEQENFDLVHFTQFNHPIRYRGNFVITIHDLTLIGHLHRQNPIKRFAFSMVMTAAVKNSKEVIAISQTTKKDILDYYKTDEEKITVIYHGIDHERFNEKLNDKAARIKKFRSKYKIDAEYLLYTGMWKKHKNILRMLEAFKIFKQSNIDSKVQLVMAGKIDNKEPEVLEKIKQINSSIKNAVVTTGFVTDDELPIAYAGAVAYIIPSLSEGFGWPPLEAMACGTPVISSKESCMPEILGEAAIYFDAYDVQSIANEMKNIATDKSLQKNMIQKGLDQVKKYIWFECATRTLDVYKKALL